MSRLEAYKEDLYELRFSPMCKPAGEVANLTMLESHTTRGRVMMLWRIASGIATWQEREIELVYQSTLDSISEAFDVFHYPLSQIMLAARADIWEAGLAPKNVKRAVETGGTTATDVPRGDTLLLAGEVALLGTESLLGPMRDALRQAELDASVWVAATPALAYALGARDVAAAQAQALVAGIETSGATTVIAEGPETAWALTKIMPDLGAELPEQVTIKLLSVALAERQSGSHNGQTNLPGPVFVHDSRPACLIADEMAGSLAILPGYVADEVEFGSGAVYEAPRQLLDALGAQRIFGTWTRSLAKTSGADDGLWLTYPDLAAGLAQQRLENAVALGAATLVTDSPLAATFLAQHESGVQVKLLAELLVS
jgi:hypothetical protein